MSELIKTLEEILELRVSLDSTLHNAVYANGDTHALMALTRLRESVELALIYAGAEIVPKQPQPAMHQILVEQDEGIDHVTLPPVAQPALTPQVVFAHIEHGDAEHKKWLLEKLIEVFSAQPAAVPSEPLTGIEHELKTDPIVFQDVLDGKKSFEIRSSFDRNFNVGDMLFLRETQFSGKHMREDEAPLIYTGRSIRKVIGYILKGPLYGLAEHWSILAFANPSPAVVSGEAEKYLELLYAVASKFPNETRHQTALRYIQQAESACNGPSIASKSDGIDR